jgi:hypothetical protein
MSHINTEGSKTYCHVTEWLETGFGLMTGFAGLWYSTWLQVRFMLSLFYTLYKPLQDTLGLLSLLLSSLAVAWKQLSRVDIPLPLGSWTLPGLCYQLLTFTAHNSWTPAVSNSLQLITSQHRPHRKHRSSLVVY